MEIKILCDRCFKNVMEDEILYKCGSAVYCKECHEEIEKELLEELVKEYLESKDIQKDKSLKLEIANHSFLSKEA